MRTFFIWSHTRVTLPSSNEHRRFSRHPLRRAGHLTPDGKPRPLHVDEALRVIDYSATEIGPQRPQKTAKPAVECLVRCDKFILNRWTLTNDEVLNCDDRFHIISVSTGNVDVSNGSQAISLSRGQTALLPACMREITLKPRPKAVALSTHLP